MTTPPPAAPRGTPPNDKALRQQLGAKQPLWDSLVETGRELEATWRWMHSEATGEWTYRSYLPGDRFLLALSLTPSGFEASLNLKAAEWEFVYAQGPEEQAALDALREKALASGDEPAWVHVDIADQRTLPMFAKLVFARSKRVQNTKAKGKRRR